MDLEAIKQMIQALGARVPENLDAIAAQEAAAAKPKPRREATVLVLDAPVIDVPRPMPGETAEEFAAMVPEPEPEPEPKPEPPPAPKAAVYPEDFDVDPRAFKMLKAFVSDDDTRYALSNVCWSGQHQEFVATNGRFLGIFKMPEHKTGPKEMVLFGTKETAALAKVKQDRYGKPAMHWDGTAIKADLLTVPGATEGTYPDHRAVVPKTSDYPKPIRLGVDLLAAAFAALKAVGQKTVDVYIREPRKSKTGAEITDPVLIEGVAHEIEAQTTVIIMPIGR